MYQYIFTCCKPMVFEKESYDLNFDGWMCYECKKPMEKEMLYKISKKNEDDTYKVLYDYRRQGPFPGEKLDE